MTRKPYILKEEEIDTLVQGIVEHGDEETYAKMRDKSLVAMRNVKDMDEMLIDMYETMLERARSANDEDQTDKELKKILYQLASMFRILAHDINREYRKLGQERNGERFLRLVSYNKEATVV